MSPIAAYATDPQPIQPIAGIVGRSGGEGGPGGESRFRAADVHSHGELASACPTCGQKLNLVV